MAKKKSYITFLLIAVITSSFFCLYAQNINGERIQVSAESLTVLKFNSPVSQYDFGTRDSYTCQLRDNDNSIVIKTIGDAPLSTNLYITEGKRAHLFVIEYIKKVDINKIKLFYDFSDLKELKKLVAAGPATTLAYETTAVAGEPHKLSKSEKKDLEKREKEIEALEAERAKTAANKIAAEEQAKRQAVENAAAIKAAEEDKKNKELQTASQIAASKEDAAKALKIQKEAEANLAKTEYAAKLQKEIDRLKAEEEKVNALKAEKTEAARIALAEKAARENKVREDAKLAEEAAKAIKLQKAEEERLVRLARELEVKKALDEEQIKEDARKKLAADKAEKERLAKLDISKKERRALEEAQMKAEAKRLLEAQQAEQERLARVEEQKNAIEEAKILAEAKRKLEAQKLEDARLALAAKRAEELEKAKQAAAVARAIQDKKDEEARLIREAKAARIQKEIEDKKAAIAAAKALKVQKEEEARIAAEAKRLREIEEKKAIALAIKAEADRKKRFADSIAALPKVYTHIELWKKYPKFVFSQPPAGQSLNFRYLNTKDTTENSAVSYPMLAESPNINVQSDVFENISFTLEDIKFSGINCFLKLHINNRSDSDYLVGPINFKWYRAADTTMIKIHPSYVTRFPVLAPKTESTIVYAIPAANVKEEDQLILLMGDRLKKIQLELVVPNELYLKKMNNQN